MKLIKNTICLVLLLILLFFTVNVNADNSTSLVNGQVYIDEDMNGILDDKDTVMKGIEIVLTRRVNNVVTESGLEIEEYEPICTIVSDEKGYFTFEIYEKELYRIKIKTSSLLSGYTYDRIDIDYESSLKDNYITLRFTKLPEKIYDVSKMTSIDLIDQAYDKAEITENEKMWLYAKYYKDDELPERYKSDIEGPDKADIHFLLNQYIVINDDKELDEYVHGIPQDDYNYLPMAYNNVRTFLNSEQPNRRYINDITIISTLNECYILHIGLPSDENTPLDITQISGNIMFYYPSTLNNSVIENIAEWTEEVLSELLTENGDTGFFNLAYSDIEKDGNNNYINVYLGEGAFSWAKPTPLISGSPTTSSGDIFIDISEGITEANYKRTFAHEFTHIVQYSLSRSLFTNSPVKSKGFSEALAVYVEEWVQGLDTSGVDNIETYFNHTDLPLFYGGDDDLHNEYGAVTFLWYIDKKYSSEDIAQKVFNIMGDPLYTSYTWWSLLDYVLVAEYNSSLSEEFSEYSSILYHIECVDYFDRYLLNPDNYYNDWNAMLQPGMINSFPYSTSSKPITQLSSHYYKFAPSSSSPTTMRVSFDGADDGYFDNNFAVYVYSETTDVYGANSSIIVDQYTSLDPSNDVYYTRKNVNEIYKSLGVCISNPDWQNQAQYELYNLSCEEHILSSWTVTTVSTCSTLGEMTRHCISGGCDYSETFSIPQNPNNHIGPLEYKVTKSPTCTEPGESILECTMCLEAALTSEIEPLGHDFTIYQNTSYQPYSSTQHKIIKQYKCSRCQELSNEIQYASHTYNIPAATCDTAKYCTVCGYVAQAALGHSYSAATCELPATCTRCGVTTGSPLGHNMGSWYTATASTCCTYGTERSDCSECSYYVESPLPLNSSNHSGGSHTEVVSSPTCTVNGSQREVCNGCSAVLSTSPIPALGHSMSGWSVITASTCCTPGTQSRCCTNSGCSYSENSSLPLNPNNHSGGTYWTVTTAATCTSSGIRSQICYGCSAVLSTQSIPALGHNWSGWVYQYTYYDEDWQSYVNVYKRTCSRCGAVEYDYI